MKFDVIVGTTGTVGEGFDEPRLDTLVFATPVVAVTQAIGRILRRRNAMPPLVLDPVDPIAVCSTQWFRRLQAYRNAGHRIRVRVGVPHEQTGPHDRPETEDAGSDDAPQGPAVPMFAF